VSDGRGEGVDPLAPARPVWTQAGQDRLKSLMYALAMVAVGVAILAISTTWQSFYPGTRSGYLGPQERSAVAEVGACHRLGPVSVDGLGYWWECDVTVRVEDGRVVQTSVDRSIVTPSDVGRQVEFREGCVRGGLTGCTYGLPVGRGSKTMVGVGQFVERILLAFLAFVVVVCLVRAGLGRDGYIRLYDRLNRRKTGRV